MRFVDTNILLYSLSFEPENSRKASIAVNLLGCTDLVLSVQVLQEFYVQATRPSRPDRLEHSQAVSFIQKWLRFRVQDNTLAVLQAALRLKERWPLSYWDAGVLAAAQASRCRELLTEDLRHGQDYGGVRVVNPFLSS